MIEMLLMNATELPSGDHDGCAAFAAGSGEPCDAAEAPVCGSTTCSPVPGLIMRRVPSAMNVRNSDVYEVDVTGASVGAGFAFTVAGSLRSNTAPCEPPPHSSPAR